jgi:hypothetical protein
LDKPLTKKELQKLDKLLHDEVAFERMVERAVRGNMRSGRKVRNPTRDS